uniref:Uncharacterized protein n=1 Tax=Spongospora subterranea TaxID=70186 RepID=A0A0H5RAF0_9EUKA|eukprot:CRZ10771.1 hypothetical protein [Spongospora subterranea]
MREQMQAGGARARLRSTCSSGRPFFPAVLDRTAAFEKEIEALERGSAHVQLQEGLVEMQRRKAERIATAELWRTQRISNVENEFDGAVKSAVDQYNEDLRLLRNKLIDNIKRNRRRFQDTNGIDQRPSSPVKKRSRTGPVFAATSTRSAAAVQNQQKPNPAKMRLSDDEVRQDLKRMHKPFVAHSPKTSRPTPLVRVDNGRLCIGSTEFRKGDLIECGRPDAITRGRILNVTETELRLIDDHKDVRLLMLAFLRSGLASIKHCISSVEQFEDVNHHPEVADAVRDKQSCTEIAETKNVMVDQTTAQDVCVEDWDKVEQNADRGSFDTWRQGEVDLPSKTNELDLQGAGESPVSTVEKFAPQSVSPNSADKEESSSSDDDRMLEATLNPVSLHIIHAEAEADTFETPIITS